MQRAQEWSSFSWPGSQRAQRPLLGAWTSSLSFLAQRHLGSGHCQPLRPLLPQTLPSIPSQEQGDRRALPQPPQQPRPPTASKEQRQRAKEEKTVGGETESPESVSQGSAQQHRLQERTGWSGNPKHHTLGLIFYLPHPHN